MRYLSLSAGCLEPVLRDDADVAALSLWPFSEVSEGLQREIACWNADYAWIVQLLPDERAKVLAEIDALDRRGFDLAESVATELSPAKVVYYSEGLGSSLPLKP